MPARHNGIIVTVRKLSGDFLVHPKFAGTIKELKEWVRVRWQIPRICQELILDGVILRESQTLHAQCKQDHAEVVLVVTLEVAKKLLLGKSSSAQKKETFNSTQQMILINFKFYFYSSFFDRILARAKCQVKTTQIDKFTT